MFHITPHESIVAGRKVKTRNFERFKLNVMKLLQFLSHNKRADIIGTYIFNVNFYILHTNLE